MQPQEYVGIDLHRRRSVIVRRSAEGESLQTTRVDNMDLAAFERAVMAAGEHPEVVVEACYGWYWAVDWLEELGCNVHLAHPLGNNWGHRRVKNDVRDAEDLIPPRCSRNLSYPTVTDPEDPPLRPERHIPNSIATMRRRLIGALVRSLPRCPCCNAPIKGPSQRRHL